jgi:nitroreductase
MIIKRTQGGHMGLDTIVKGRRSIRKYSQEEVSQDLLQEVLEIALWAPSGMNRQDWELVVVRGKERDRLLEIVSKSQVHILPHLKELFPKKIINISLQIFKDFGDAPVVVLIYIPKDVIFYEKDLDDQGRYHLEFNRYNRLLSAAALTQNLLLAAYSKGLGTCWMTGPKYVEKEINELLNMTNKELVSIIPIGYPDQLPPAPPRKEGAIKWVDF